MAFLFSSSDSESAARTTSSIDRSSRHYQSFSGSTSSSHRTPKRSIGQDENYDSPPTSVTSPSSIVIPRWMESSRRREPKASESSNMSPMVVTSRTASSAACEPKLSVSGTSRKESSHRKDPSPEGSKRAQHAVSMSDMRVRSTHASAHQPMPSEFGQLSIKQASSSSTPITQLSANASRSGSQSDSGLKVRRPHEYSSAASKHNLHLLPVDFRQPSPTSPARMAASGSASDGGGSSDRASSPLIASRHDIKRLLSKPAAPSRASTISITSDSDSPATNFAWSPSSMYGSGSPRRGRIDELAESPSTSRRTKAGKMRAVSTSAELGVATLGVDDKSTRSRPGSSRGSSMHRGAPGSSSSKDKDKDKEPHTRNVLKKRSAGDGLRPGSALVSPLDTTPESLRPGSGRHGSLAKPHADLAFERSPRSMSSLSARDPRGSGAAANPRQPSPTPKLTPAGAIAQAYKAQNDRREELAAQARGEEEGPRMPSSSSVGDLKQWQLPTSLPFEAYLNEHREDRARQVQSSSSAADMDEARAPYYTVFGSTTGRVVAVGSAEDDRLTFTSAGAGEVDRGRSTTPTARTTVSAQHTPSVRQSLSRKMSGRFRRAKAESQATNIPAPIAEFARGGRPSLQERRSASLPKERRKSLRLSMDDGDDLGTSSYKSRSAPSSKHSGSKKSATPSASDETYPAPAGARGKLHKEKEREKGKEKEKEKEKDQEEEVSPGGKLWKLVKRISTGGLRDRYQSGGSILPPPPVPAIPKGLLSVPSSRATFEVRTPTESPGEPGSGVNRFMQSRTSLSGVRPSSAHGREKPEKPASRRPSTGLPKGHRPSTATRSSSPHSSTDMASTQFFHRTHSNHSSSSSYGGELPPIPRTSIGKWILPPSELYRLDSGQAVTPAPSPRRSTAQSTPPSQTTPTLPSLPHPPRKPTLPTQNDSPPSSSRSSLDIPLFSTAKAVNRFSQRKPSVSHTHETRPSLKIISSSMPKSDFGLVSSTSLVPPRPARSSRRPSATTISPLSPDASHSPMRPPTALSIDTSDTLSVTKSNDSADGHSNASTARQQQGSPVAQLTFREFDQSSPRTAWTEQEKHQKWEDLLERSARAGGTLHLGEGGLLSDSMRFSNYSESM